MTNFKEHLSNPIFKIIGEAGHELNQDTYVVGGFVRDTILKRENKDIDVVTIGKGIELARLVATKLGNKVKVSEYKNFGTALIVYKGYEIEFVGARKESYRRNSRKPIVEEGTLKEDQDRRDFTINSMAFSLNQKDFGAFLDPHNGILSLEYKEIRTPLKPEETYSDDPLRMMRAIRFAAQLNFNIEEQSYKAIKQTADRISIVSAERIIDELNKIILSPIPSKGFMMLSETGLLGLIFPEMVDLMGVDVKDGMTHKDNYLHTLEVLDNVAKKSDNLWLRWAAILHDIAKPPTKRFHIKSGWTFHGHEDLGAKMTPKIFRKLKLPLDHKMKYVQKLVKLHLRPIALIKDIVTDSAIRRLLFDGGDDLEDLMILCEADITTKNKNKQSKYLTNFKKVRKKLKEVEAKDHVKNMQPPISGQCIMDTFNINPSREIGLLKNIIKEAILDGKIENNFDDAFKLMLEEGRKLGLTPIDEHSDS